MKATDFNKASEEEILTALDNPDFRVIHTSASRSVPNIGEILTVDVPAAIGVVEKIISLFSALFQGLGHPKKHFVALDNAVAQLKANDESFVIVNSEQDKTIGELIKRIEALEAKQ